MGLFRRTKQPRPDLSAGAIADFWSWWQAHRAELTEAIPQGRLPEYLDAVAALVNALDPGLAWEFGAGTTSTHQLTLTADGDPWLRRIARRWLQAAPPADDTWAFYDLRQPTALNSVLEIAEGRLRLADLRVRWVEHGSGLDVALYHPLFPALSQSAREHVTLLALDAALGEEAMELWVDAIQGTTVPLEAAQPLADLPAAVAQCADAALTDGQLGWTMLRAEDRHGPVLILCLRRLAAIQAPLFDEHVGVRLPYPEPTPEGFPGPRSLAELRELEDRLSALLGPDGRLVAVETGAGVRTLHYYVDSGTQAAAPLRAAAAQWRHGRATVSTQHDPAWDAVRHLRG